MKPHPRYLTHFYLMISAGGALGGLLVGLVAPHVFNALYEMQIGMAACAFLILIVLSGDSGFRWFRDLLRPWQMLIGAAALAAAGAIAYVQRGVLTAVGSSLVQLVYKKFQAPEDFLNYVLLVSLVLAAVAVLAVLHLGRIRRRWLAFGMEIVAMVLFGVLAYQVRQMTSGYRVTVRNFYGALRVRDSGPATDFDATRTLTNGTINHGEQFLFPARRDLPTTYYGPNTGVGLAIRDKQKIGAIRVGVIGLGTGTIASYGRLGDYYRFYEINPLVLRLAHTEFTFLGDSRPRWRWPWGTRGCRSSGKRRRTSTCWRWMRLPATRYRCTCSRGRP